MSEVSEVDDALDRDHSRILNHTLAPPAGHFEIDAVHTFVTFSAQHLVVGRVRGRFNEVAGTITVAENLPASALEVTVRMASIDTKNPTRDEDLLSAHYLDAGQFPVMTYRSVDLRELPGGQWEVAGEMTIRGVTRPVDLTVQYRGGVTDAHGNVRISFNARASITRSDFGITYELAKEAGTLLVGRDVAIEIDVEAVAPL